MTKHSFPPVPVIAAVWAAHQNPRKNLPARRESYFNLETGDIRLNGSFYTAPVTTVAGTYRIAIFGNGIRLERKSSSGQWEVGGYMQWTYTPGDPDSAGTGLSVTNMYTKSIDTESIYVIDPNTGSTSGFKVMWTWDGALGKYVLTNR